MISRPIPMGSTDDDSFYWTSKILCSAIESIAAIASPGSSKTVRSLLIQLANDDCEVRFVLIALFQVIEQLIPFFRWLAIEGLGKVLSHHSSIFGPELMDMYQIAEPGDKKTIAALFRSVCDEEPAVRTAAAIALCSILPQADADLAWCASEAACCAPRPAHAPVAQAVSGGGGGGGGGSAAGRANRGPRARGPTRRAAVPISSRPPQTDSIPPSPHRLA